jgi:streptogramin lyase
MIMNANNTASFSFSSPYVREYRLPSGSFPNGILVDRNGTVWSVRSQSHRLIAFTPKSYPLPNARLLD